MPNNPDPRLKIAIDYLADQTDIGASEIVDEAAGLLRKLDAEDPLRQPPGDEAVEAGLEAVRAAWNTGANADRWLALSDLSIIVMPALTDALAVMAGTEVKERGDTETDRRSYLEEIAWAISECRREGLRDVEDYANRIEANLVAAGFTIVRAERAATPKHSPLPEKVEFTSTTIDGAPTKVRYTPPAGRPEWTAEQRVIMHLLRREWADCMNESELEMATETERHLKALGMPLFLDPITKPEPVWPPEKCLNQMKCGDAGFCLDTHPLVDCPHAGERADA